jgi:hypothetical protein
MFADFYNKQREVEPNDPIYISLCKVLQGSGEDKEVIESYFNTYMKVGIDYDKKDRKIMVDYLFEQSKDRDE